MPLFDFACVMCGHRWEDLAAVAQANPNCPECTSHEVTRLTGLPYVGNTARGKIMDRGLRHGAAADNKKIQVYINRHEDTN